MILLHIGRTVFAPWRASLALSVLLFCAAYAGAATIMVTTTNDSGAGSLRQAILDAAVSPGTNKIQFNIPNPTSAPFTINPQSALPGLTNNVIIDGYTQPGASRNTLSNGNNAVIKIRLSGVSATGADGLDIRNAGCEVYGLAIVNFPGNGLYLRNSGNAIIQGNFIGLEPDGVNVGANGGLGIRSTAAGTIIGGSAPEQRNMISGNLGGGLSFQNSSNHIVQGNYIGTDASGTLPRGNTGSGIYITNAAMNNFVGGTNAGAGNVIAHNIGAGVWIASGTNAVLGNSIFANGGLGIDLGPAGVTPNDTGDIDSGANDQQNSPSLTGVTNASGSTTIRGTLRSRASTTYRIEFFASPNRDPSGYGEGQTYLGFTNVTTDVSGTATIAASLTTGTLLNQFVSATATDPANNSSEFSLAPSVFLAEPPIITYHPQDSLIWRFGETNSLAVVADGSAALSYQWFREGTLLAGQTNRLIWFNGVQPSDLGLYSVIVSNIYGVVGPLSARLLLDPNSGIILADNLNDSGPGSLRQAILDANASAVSPAIYFGYSGSGPFTIRLTSPLPSLMVPMVLDGTTVPGYAGQPLVELDGGGIFGDGLLLTAGQTTVRGLALFNFGGSGLRLETGGANLIEGNFIGLRADGITALPNGQHGILVMASVGNQIGGSTPASRNVISGNLGEGIRLDSTGTSNTVIQGNFIGTDATGTQPVGNGGSGIEVADAVDNLVGGTGPGEGNRIAFNGRNGVMVLSGQGEVLGNAIFANAALGIDLGGDGLTPNDPGDTDTGPNDLQNSPEILNATNGPSGTSLSGVLRSTPNTLFRLEFFAGPACGQATIFVGTTQAVSDSSGDALFSVNFPTGDLTGSLVMATATDPDGHTSELSLCQRVAVPPYIVNQPATQTVYQGDAVTLSIVAAGTPPLHYQWLRNGVAVGGATNTSLTFNSVLASHDGLYTVVITNIDGTVSSAPAVLTVLVPTLPTFLTQPLSQSVSPGATVVFSVSYSGVGPFAVQWRLNGVNIEGATNTSLVLNNVQATNSGTYSVVVSTPAGAVDSTNAVLTVLLPALIFRDNFASLARLNTDIGAGRASNSLATLQTGEPLHANKPGGKSIWIIWQAPHTGVATLTTAGSTFDSLLGVYTGNTLATLVEVGNDDDSGGFHTSAVKFNAVSGTQYKIAVAGFGGASGDVVLNWSLETTAQALPVIRTQPTNQTVVPGAIANFTVGATGTGLAYQWFFNGAAIPGAVSTNLTLASVNDTHAGKYFVRVSNAARSVHSRHVHLEIAATDTDVSQVRTANKFLEGSSTALKP